MRRDDNVRGGRRLIRAACRSWDRSIRRSSEYLMSHYGPSDISLRHAERAGKITRTDKQMQQAAKQDEKQQEDIQKREESHNQKQTRRTSNTTTGRKTSISTIKAENKNYTYQKETTRVLHPATRLAPENGGIPPFYGVC